MIFRKREIEGKSLKRFPGSHHLLRGYSCEFYDRPNRRIDTKAIDKHISNPRQSVVTGTDEFNQLEL
jgi:hypothetical protein